MEQWLEEMCNDVEKTFKLEGMDAKIISGYKGTGQTYLSMVVKDEPIIIEGRVYEVGDVVTNPVIETMDVMTLIDIHKRGA